MEGQHYILQKGEKGIDNDDDNDDEIIILRIPFHQNNKGKKRKNTSNNNNNNNNNNIKDYFKHLQSSTEKSISILINNFGVNKNHFYIGTNFYCPFHENKYTSKSPSATFTNKNHTFTCFSTNCPLKQTTTTTTITFVKINSIKLLKNYK